MNPLPTYFVTKSTKRLLHSKFASLAEGHHLKFAMVSSQNVDGGPCNLVGRLDVSNGLVVVFENASVRINFVEVC